MITNAEKLPNLPQIRGKYLFHEPMKNYLWLNTGGFAEVMFLPEDVEDLQFFMQHKPAELNVFVIGGGSNLLIRDGGIKGTVIKLKNKNFAKVKIEKEQVIIGAGLNNVLLKSPLIKNELGGLEFLCSIPGSLGGALRTNAGCFGSEIADVLVSAQIMDGQGNIKTVTNKDFHFSYRKSDFPADWIILEVCLQAKKSVKQDIEQKINDNANYRKTHQPQHIRTAGSTFKNPQGYKAWELIKNSNSCNLKFGGASFSEQHCNFLQNDGTATAKNIEDLVQQTIKNVKAYNGVDLELEVKIVGEKE